MTSQSDKCSSTQPAAVTSPGKMLALPRLGRQYTFDDIANLVWANILWHQSVLHGVCTELAANRLSVGYVTALVEGVIVLT